MSKRLQSMFSSRILMGSCLTFRSFIHCESVLVYGVREWSSFILLHVTVQFSQHHLMKKQSFFHWIFFPALVSFPFSDVYFKKLAAAEVREVAAWALLQDFDGTFRCFIHFESMFVYGVRQWSSFLLLRVAVQFSQHH